MSDKPDLSRATPRPWVADPDYRAGMSWNVHILSEANPNLRICFMTNTENTGISQANAALIVEAVNAYDRLTAVNAALVEALRDAPHPARYDGRPGVEQFFEDYDIWRHKQRAALKLAEEDR